MKARGLCPSCYQRARFLELPPEEQERRRLQKQATAKRYSNTRQFRAKQRVYMKEYRKKLPTTRPDYYYRSMYGITKADRDAMIEAQGGLCAICRCPPTGTTKQNQVLHIDHDHVTGRVRAMLCSSCNFGLGKFKDDPELLAIAAQYIYMHKPLVAVA